MTQATSPDTQGASAGSSTVREELSQDASRLTQTASTRVEQATDSRKEQATTAAHAVSSAIDKAASALRDDDKAPDWLTTAFEKTARQIEELARTVEGKDVSELRRGVTDFARQSPTAFLAASAAAGFAAARFLRAGSEYQAHEEQNDRQFTGGTSSMPGATGGSSMGAVGAASGADLGSTGGSTGNAGADQTVWSPASAPLDREGALS